MTTKNKIVTISDLSKAIKQVMYENFHTDYENALDDAHYILNLFGFSSKIIDNVLRPEDRRFLNDYEELGIIKIPNTPDEITTLYNGKEWKIYCVHLNVDSIKSLVEKFGSRKKEEAIETPYTKNLWQNIEKEKAVA